MTARYALYYAPEPSHPLWLAGCRWLGRDPSQPAFQAHAHEATGTPRRYGFHATLKAPMRLRIEAPDAFLDAVDALAARTPAFEMPALEVGTLRGFVALLPVEPVGDGHPLRRLADACVRDLEPWRAPAEAKKEMHVFEHWRFHMTLSDTLPDDASGIARRERIRDDARRHFADALSQPLTCESLCVFTEPAEGEPFVLAHRAALAR
jgi:hypothetical protein